MESYSVPNTPMKILTQPFYFEYDGKTEKIPAWYAYDWLSIPQLFQNVVDMNESNNVVAWLIHDYLYSLACHIIVTRKDADCKLFNDVDGYGKYAVYIWVRAWWWYSWKKDSNYKKYKKEIEEARRLLKLN